MGGCKRLVRFRQSVGIPISCSYVKPKSSNRNRKDREEEREDHATEDGQGQRCPSFGYFDSRESKKVGSEHRASGRYFINELRGPSGDLLAVSLDDSWPMSSLTWGGRKSQRKILEGLIISRNRWMFQSIERKISGALW